MTIDTNRIAELERVNYCATLSSADATPGLEVIIRDDVIITSSEVFPAPDANHACLLRATHSSADTLIGEITEHYHSRGLPAIIALSPACTPADLTQRLSESGFSKQGPLEAWMTLDNVLNRNTPDPFEGVTVQRIGPRQAEVFSQIYAEVFGLSPEYAPAMAQVLEPTLDLPNVFHYLAAIDGEPIGTFSLLHYETFGVVGSAGVTKRFRRSGAATNLVIQAVREAQRLRIETLIQQTEAARPLERLLRITGFERVFTRTYYQLNERTS